MYTAGLSTAASIKLFDVNEERIPGFGKRVQEILDEANVNRSQAMRKLGTAYSTLTKWVAGRNTPNVAQLVPLTRLAGVRIDWLVTGKGPKYVDKAKNDANDTAAVQRLDGYQRAVDAYLATELATGISPAVVAMLRAFDFSSLGIHHPAVRDVHRVRDLMDMQVQLRQSGDDGDTD